jgi:hypothetical protein
LAINLSNLYTNYFLVILNNCINRFLNATPRTDEFPSALRALLLLGLYYIFNCAVIAETMLKNKMIFTEQGSTIEGAFYKHIQHSSFSKVPV